MSVRRLGVMYLNSVNQKAEESLWQTLWNKQEKAKTKQQKLQDSTICANQQLISRPTQRMALPVGQWLIIKTEWVVLIRQKVRTPPLTDQPISQLRDILLRALWAAQIKDTRELPNSFSRWVTIKNATMRPAARRINLFPFEEIFDFCVCVCAFIFNFSWRKIGVG